MCFDSSSITMKTYPSIFVLNLAVALLTLNYLPAQDDSYESVRFVNESHEPVTIKVWNPRIERDQYLWKIEAGKTLDFIDEKGKKLRIGVYSSMIKVNDTTEKSIVSISAKQEDGTRVITWTGKDFKGIAKPSE